MKGNKIKFTFDKIKEVKKEQLAEISYTFNFSNTRETYTRSMALTGKIIHNITKNRLNEMNIKITQSSTFDMGERKFESKSLLTISISNNYNVKSKPEDKPVKPKDDED